MPTLDDFISRFDPNSPPGQMLARFQAHAQAAAFAAQPRQPISQASTDEVLMSRFVGASHINFDVGLRFGASSDEAAPSASSPLRQSGFESDEAGGQLRHCFVTELAQIDEAEGAASSFSTESVGSSDEAAPKIDEAVTKSLNQPLLYHDVRKDIDSITSSLSDEADEATAHATSGVEAEELKEEPQERFLPEASTSTSTSTSTVLWGEYQLWDNSASTSTRSRNTRTRWVVKSRTSTSNASELVRFLFFRSPRRLRASIKSAVAAGKITAAWGDKLAEITRTMDANMLVAMLERSDTRKYATTDGEARHPYSPVECEYAVLTLDATGSAPVRLDLYGEGMVLQVHKWVVPPPETSTGKPRAANAAQWVGYLNDAKIKMRQAREELRQRQQGKITTPTGEFSKFVLEAVAVEVEGQLEGVAGFLKEILDRVARLERDNADLRKRLADGGL